MTPKYFLSAAGAIMTIVGILGLVGGMIGPTPGDSLFGSAWYFNNVEIWAHLVVGILAVAFALFLSDKAKKIASVIIGIALIGIGTYSLFGNVDFLGAHLEHPADTFFNLIFGVWALVSAAKIDGKTNPGESFTITQ
ncbi:MAG: hypothetical protein AAB861_02480 [Patescibacteria group bacterium]